MALDLLLELCSESERSEGGDSPHRIATEAVRALAAAWRHDVRAHEVVTRSSWGLKSRTPGRGRRLRRLA
jgi:hypothetical protein